MSNRLNGALGVAAVALGIGLVIVIVFGIRSLPESEPPPSGPPPREEPPEVASASAAQPPAPPGMILVPPGALLVGDTEEYLLALFRGIEKRNPGSEYWTSLARPQDRERVVWTGFWIDRTEVTNREYDEFLVATGGKPPELQDETGAVRSDWHRGRVIPGLEEHPVRGVSAFDAEAYARFQGKRLPTELEWEYAARSGDGRAYPWGDEWAEDRCNYGLHGQRVGPTGSDVGTTPVGDFPLGASPFGVLDMAGNVWEWTSSEFELYPGNTRSTGDEGGRTIKGGGYPQVPHALRCSVRIGLSPTFRTSALGFRCARDAD